MKVIITDQAISSSWHGLIESMVNRANGYNEKARVDWYKQKIKSHPEMEEYIKLRSE